LFAEFEHDSRKRMHDGEALTADKLTEIYNRLNKKYCGDADVSDAEFEEDWERRPYFYMEYYVYQYATSYCAATALTSQTLKEGEQAVDRYINNFLKARYSDYPIEVLKKAGVDMTSKQPILDALDVFEEKLNEMEELLLK